MGTAYLRVVLTMENSLLSSAIQQCLADNPRLEVEIRPPDDDRIAPAEPARVDVPRTVEIGLLDDPVRFAINADGREWIVTYQSLAGLAQVLAELEKTPAQALSMPSLQDGR
jgi:hypothetical protein